MLGKLCLAVVLLVLCAADHVDFGEQRLCMPAVQSVTVPCSGDAPTKVLGWESSDVQMMAPLLHPAVVEAGENLTVQIVFLPSKIGLTHAVVVVDTSAGKFVIRAQGRGTENEFGLEPVVNAIIPARGVYQPSIFIHNPLPSEVLTVTEIFTTEDFLHLRVPSSESWQVRPQSKSSVASLAFQSSIPGAYKSFVRIKTSQANFLVPFQVTVVEQSIFLQSTSAFLGTAQRKDRNTLFEMQVEPIHQPGQHFSAVTIYNFEDKPIELLGVEVVPKRVGPLKVRKHQSQVKRSPITVRYKPKIVIPPGGKYERAVIVGLQAKYIENPPVSHLQSKESTRMVFFTNSTNGENPGKSYLSFNFELVTGRLYCPHREVPAFIMPTDVQYVENEKLSSQWKSASQKLPELLVTNQFDSAIKISDVSIVGPSFRLFRILGFKEVILQPGNSLEAAKLEWGPEFLNEETCSRIAFSLRDARKSNGILFRTNVTSLFVPFRFHHRLLRGSAHQVMKTRTEQVATPSNQVLDVNLGLCESGTKRTYRLSWQNVDPVPIRILGINTCVDSEAKLSSLSPLGITFLDLTQPPTAFPVELDPQSLFEMDIEISIPSIESNSAEPHRFRGCVQLVTEAELFNVSLTGLGFSGLVTSKFEALSSHTPLSTAISHPSLVGHVILESDSSLPVAFSSISLPPYSITSQHISIMGLPAVVRRGKPVKLPVVLDFLTCGENNQACQTLLAACPTTNGALVDISSLSTESINETIHESWKVWKSLEDFNQTRFELTIKLISNISGWELSVPIPSHSVVCPSLTRASNDYSLSLSFGAVPIGETSFRSLFLRNPTAKSIQGNLEPISDNISAFFFPKGEFLLGPFETKSVGEVHFSPNFGDTGLTAATILLRNNLTGLEALPVSGSGLPCRLKAYVPGSAQLQDDETPFAILSKSDFVASNSGQLTWDFDGRILSKVVSIQIRNVGSNNCNIQTCSLDNGSDSQFGIDKQALNVPRSLSPKESFNVPVQFSSDCYTVESISKLSLRAAGGQVFLFPLGVHTPQHLLDECLLVQAQLYRSGLSAVAGSVAFLSIVYLLKKYAPLQVIQPLLVKRSIQTETIRSPAVKKAAKHDQEPGLNVPEYGTSAQAFEKEEVCDQALHENPTAIASEAESLTALTQKGKASVIEDTEIEDFESTMNFQEIESKPEEEQHFPPKVASKCSPKGKIPKPFPSPKNKSGDKKSEQLAESARPRADGNVTKDTVDQQRLSGVKEIANKSVNTHSKDLKPQNRSAAPRKQNADMKTTQQQGKTHLGLSDLQKTKGSEYSTPLNVSEQGIGKPHIQLLQRNKDTQKLERTPRREQSQQAKLSASNGTGNVSQRRAKRDQLQQQPPRSRQMARQNQPRQQHQYPSQHQHGQLHISSPPRPFPAPAFQQRWAEEQQGAKNVDATQSLPFPVSTLPFSGQNQKLPTSSGLLQTSTGYSSDLPWIAGEHERHHVPQQKESAQILAEPGPLPPNRGVLDSQPNLVNQSLPGLSFYGQSSAPQPFSGRTLFSSPPVEPMSRETFFDIPNSSSYFSSHGEGELLGLGLPDFSKMDMLPSFENPLDPPRPSSRQVMPPPGLGYQRQQIHQSRDGEDMLPPVGILRALSLDEGEELSRDSKYKSPKESEFVGTLDFLSS